MLDFKRELQLEDSTRLFEILGSHYLELNSDKAMVETDKAMSKLFEDDRKMIIGCEMGCPPCDGPFPPSSPAEGGSRAGGVSVNLNFTFSIFVCVSILLLHKDKVCCADDAASIYGALNRLAGYCRGGGGVEWGREGRVGEERS